MHLPPVASAAVRSTAVVLSLSLSHCLLLLLLLLFFVVVWFLFGYIYLVSFRFLVLLASAEAKRASCFTSIVCLMTWFFFTVPWVGMQFVIMVLPVRTYFFFKKKLYIKTIMLN